MRAKSVDIKAADIEAARAALEERKRLIGFEALGRTLSYSPYLSRVGLEHFRRGADTLPYRAYGLYIDSQNFANNPESHLYHISQFEATHREASESSSSESSQPPRAYVIDLCKLLYGDSLPFGEVGGLAQSMQDFLAKSESTPRTANLAMPNPLEAISLLRRYSTLPLIHADIFFEEYQILESALFGADLLLLPCSHLDTQTLSKLLGFAHRLEMGCFVYVRDKDELKRAIFSGASALYVPESALEKLLSLIPNTQIIASDSRQKYGVDVEICPMSEASSESSEGLSEV